MSRSIHRATGWTAGLMGFLVCSAFLSGDTRSVEFDPNVDFSTIRTFTIRDGKVNSEKPELNNRLFIQALGDSIRGALTAKGLKEVAANPDVFIDFRIAGMDYSVIGGRRGTRIPDGPGRQRGFVVPGTGPQPELFTEGTLVIDISKDQYRTLIWRGTYRDEERSSPTLARRLPEDARKLLSEYPPRKKT
jgi:hypothetical protein